MELKKRIKYAKISIPESVVDEVKQIINKYPLWRNPTEFIIDAVRNQIFQTKILENNQKEAA